MLQLVHVCNSFHRKRPEKVQDILINKCELGQSSLQKIFQILELYYDSFKQTRSNPHMKAVLLLLRRSRCVNFTRIIQFNTHLYRFDHKSS